MTFNIGWNWRGHRAALWLAVAFFACATGFASAKNNSSRAAPAARATVAAKATIYVYRNAAIFGAGNSLDLFANHQPITRITNGGYFDFTVAPGTVELGVMTAMRPIAILSVIVDNAGGIRRLQTLHAEAGHTYYFRYEPAFGGERLVPVVQEEAVKDMTGMSRFQPAQK